MEHGHEHQESQSHGPQEEDDLLYKEPCRDVGGEHQPLQDPAHPCHSQEPEGFGTGQICFQSPALPGMAIVRTQ